MIFTKRNIIFSVGLLTLFGLIGFVEKTTSGKEVNNILINIKDEYGNHFVDEGDIVKIITANNTDSIRGKLYDEVSLKAMEINIRLNKFVEEAEVYRDHKGNILIDVVQKRPVARIIQQDGPHAYIGEKGNILPVSDKFTARVVLVDGEKAGQLLDSAFRSSEEAKAFVKLLHIIDKDPFLKAQVSQITFKKNGEIDLRPQVGGEVILFGKLEEPDEKFKKLKIYYKEIVQLKGFNTYKTVNLKYKDQIICE